MKRSVLYMSLLWCVVAYGMDDVVCPTITLTADKTTVNPDSAVTLTANVENGSGYYVWLKDGEEITDEYPMSLGEIKVFHTDTLVSKKTGTVAYKIVITSRQCEVSEEIKITVTNPSSANEQVYDYAGCEAVIYNMAGVRVYEPLTQKGIYIVKRAGKTYKVQVK